MASVEVPVRGGIEFLAGPDENREIMMSFSDTRLAEIYLGLGIRFAQKNGYEVTDTLRTLLWNDALKREEEFLAPVRARGVHEGLRALFSAKCAGRAIVDTRFAAS